MVGIVFASHGGLAQGLYDTVKMLVGEVQACRVVSLVPGMAPEQLDEQLTSAIGEVDTGDGVIVFTDVASGTPYNRALGLKHRGLNIEVVSGVNVPMVLELAFGAEGDKTELAETALQNAKEGITRVCFDRDTTQDEDDF